MNPRATSFVSLSVTGLGIALALALALALPRTTHGGQTSDTEPGFTQRTQWVMGTTLRIHLPNDREDLDQLFASCFAMAQHWEAMLSPWDEDAPLTRLSRAQGKWVELPDDVLEYLRRARSDAMRTDGTFDITLEFEGSDEIEIDWDGSRARLPVGAHRLDPGGDGKGIALDAVAALLHRAGVHQALLDFGGSSMLAIGSGPGGRGWRVSLAGPDGAVVGELSLRHTALSVSSTVQREYLEDGGVKERFHLLDLARGATVTVRRSVTVLSPSATEAEVLSTTLAIRGQSALDESILESFSPASLVIFEDEAAPVFRGGFEEHFVSTRERAREQN